MYTKINTGSMREITGCLNMQQQSQSKSTAGLKNLDVNFRELQYSAMRHQEVVAGEAVFAAFHGKKSEKCFLLWSKL